MYWFIIVLSIRTAIVEYTISEKPDVHLYTIYVSMYVYIYVNVCVYWESDFNSWFLPEHTLHQQVVASSPSPVPTVAATTTRATMKGL